MVLGCIFFVSQEITREHLVKFNLTLIKMHCFYLNKRKELKGKKSVFIQENSHTGDANLLLGKVMECESC